MSLNIQIIVGAVLGVITGLVLSMIGQETPAVKQTISLLGLVGGVFISLLKMILVPLVFTSITVGISNLRAHAQMGKVWKLSLFYYLSTTALAVILGLIAVNVFKPGLGQEITMLQQAASANELQTLSAGGFLANFVQNLFVNPFAAMANGQILPTILFAIFLGIALIAAGDKARTVLAFMNESFELVMMIVGWIMTVLPIGIFCLLAKLVATQDVTLLTSLGKFIAVVLGATLFHGFVSLPLLLVFFGRMSPKKFYSAVEEALITALSTSSSSATLPVTYRCVTDDLKVNKDVAGFVLPLGATINMDGTAMYEAIAALFIANLVGVDLNIVQQMIVFLMAILASIGAPGIPSAGMVTMVMVLQAVGLPAEGIAILLPIDRLLDAVRTMVNVKGDTIGSVIVDRFTSPAA